MNHVVDFSLTGERETSCAQVDGQSNVTDLLRKGEGSLTDVHCLLVLTALTQRPDRPRQHVGKSRAVTNPLGEAGGFAQVLDEAPRLGCHENGARQGRLLHARGHVGGLALQAVGPVRIGTLRRD